MCLIVTNMGLDTNNSQNTVYLNCHKHVVCIGRGSLFRRPSERPDSVV